MRRALLALPAALLLAAAAAAQGDLLAAMPSETIVYVRATGLREQWNRFFRSAAWQRIETTGFAEVAQGLRKAREGIAAFEAQMNVNLEQYAAALFGADAALLLCDDGHYVLLIRTDDLPKLQAANDFFAGILRQQGRLTREGAERYEGVDINTGLLGDPRAPGAPASGRHYAVDGNLFLLSGDLETLRRTILTLKGKRPGLAESPRHARATELFRKEAFLRIYLDGERLAVSPAFDRLRPLFGDRPLGRFLFDTARANAAATPLAVMDATGGDALLLRGTRLLDLQKLPSLPRDLLPPADAATDIPCAVPEDALITLTGRLNKAALWRAFGTLAAAADPAAPERIALRARQAATALGGLDFERELLPALGDQNALLALPGGEGELPGLALVVEMAEPQRLPAALRTLVGAGVVVAQIEAEKKKTPSPADLRRAEHGGVEMVTVELRDPALAGILAPTFFSRGKWLVIATSPGTPTRWRAPTPRPPPPANGGASEPTPPLCCASCGSTGPPSCAAARPTESPSSSPRASSTDFSSCWGLSRKRNCA